MSAEHTPIPQFELASCPQCGHTVAPQARFCDVCGMHLPVADAALEPTAPVIAAPSPAQSPAVAPALPAGGTSAAPVHAGAFRLGTVLGSNGRYRIERMLDKGGFGHAYLAYDTQLDRYCVVKHLRINPVWSAADQHLVQQNFQREARLLVTLNTPGHPNIPEIYEYLAESDCVVMKYIEGQSLIRMLKRRVDPLPEQDALRYIKDVCSALVYMHSRTPEPVLHRDIKPDNIMLDRAGRVWVIDFGLSKAVPTKLHPRGTHPSHGVGTLGYSPPEQRQGRAEPRSDVYALAATLYMLLTNCPPAHLAGAMHEQPTPPSVRQINPAIRPEVERLIMRGMASDITARPTAQEFLAELEVLLAQPQIPSLPPPEPLPTLPDFVGRELELAYFAEELATAHLAVITGQAGVGKTALATTLAVQVGDPARIFWHAFHRDEGIATIIWKLAAFLAWNGQADLWRLLHTTAQAAGQPPPLEVLVDYLLQMVCGHGYLLCFDDFHYVEDDPQLDHLVDRLLNELQAGTIALIVTSRHKPAFMRSDAFAPLTGLNSADMRRLLDARKLALSDPLATDLYAATEGNVQLLTLAIEALQRAADPGRLIAHLSQTDNIERYLMAEVDERLTAEERSVMSAVAVLLGYGGTRAVIETLLESKDTIGRTLHDLTNRFLLIVSDGVAEREYTLHAMVQDFYYNLLSRRARQALHRRAVLYYESEEPDALKAARHLERAGEYARAAQLATADVWALINRGQARALHHLLERFTARQLDTDQWVAVNIARGEVAALLGDHSAARASYTQALAQLDALPDTPAVRERRARACRGMGESLEPESPQQALAWLERGLDALAGDPSLEEAYLRFGMGSVLITGGKHAAAAQALEASLRLLPESASDWRARVLMNLGVIHCSQGDLERGKEYFLRTLEIYQQTQNDWRIAAVRQNLGMVRDIVGDWAGAAAEYRQALDLAERLGDVGRQLDLALTLGNLRAKQGDTAAALDHLSTSLALARRHALRDLLAYSQASLANLHIQLAAWAEAEAALAEAERTALELAEHSHPQLPEIYRGWAQVRLGHGHAEAARADAERAVRLARELEASLDEGMGLRVLGQALLASGQHEQAMTAFAQSLALLGDTDPYEAARTRAQWGLALMSAGDCVRGTSLLQAARTTFQALGAKQDWAAVDERLRDAAAD